MIGFGYRPALSLSLVLGLAGACGQSPEKSAVMLQSVPDNQALLEEVNAAKIWFHARKVRPIWARQLNQATQVTTLEGEELVPAGTFLCRGEAGDIWPQTAERLEAKYTPTEEVDADGWRKHLPRPDNQGVLAAPIGHPFEVQASWGKLQGKAGDYLVKNFEDQDTPNPSDVWIVDQKLFAATYEPVDKDR